MLNKWIKSCALQPAIVQNDSISSTSATLLSFMLANPRLMTKGQYIPAGYHFILFPSFCTEEQLSSDGYTKEHAPPDPYNNRVWAGGRIEWKHPLAIGQNVIQASSISNVRKNEISDSVFVTIDKYISKEHDDDYSIKEQRTLVYMKPSNDRNSNKIARKAISSLHKPDFSLEFTPSRTTLFRYSALTYNSHKIHLDPEYTKETEGFPDCLVHGPLTCTLLLNFAETHLVDKNVKFKSFSYRALSPLFVNRKMRLNLKINEGTCELWAEDVLDNRIGMKGTLEI